MAADPVAMEGSSTGAFGITDVNFNEKLSLNKSMILYADYQGTIQWDLDGDGAYDDATGKMVQLCAPGAAKTEAVAFSWEELQENFGWTDQSTVTVGAQARVVFFTYAASYTFEIDDLSPKDTAALSVSAISENQFKQAYPITFEGIFSESSSFSKISDYTINSVQWSVSSNMQTVYSSTSYGAISLNDASCQLTHQWTPSENFFGDCTLTCDVNYTFDSETKSIQKSATFTVLEGPRSLGLEFTTHKEESGAEVYQFMSTESIFCNTVLSDEIKKIDNFTVNAIDWVCLNEDGETLFNRHYSESEIEAAEQTEESMIYENIGATDASMWGLYTLKCTFTYTQMGFAFQTVEDEVEIELIPPILCWGTYEFENEELVFDDWRREDEYFINMECKGNMEFKEKYHVFLKDYALLPSGWTCETDTLEFLYTKEKTPIPVLEIIPINAAFLCVSDLSGEIMAVYEYTFGDSSISSELIARQISYNRELEAGDRIWYYDWGDEPDTVKKVPTEYFLERNFSGTNGASGYGLVSSTKNRPYIAFRGIESEFADILADVDARGIGRNQFESVKTDVADWLDKKANKQLKTMLVGHSLGGALCQWVAADYLSSNKNRTLSGITTYNSTGISGEFAKKFNENSSRAGTVIHNIVNGDVVSMFGEAFINGTNRLYSYSQLNIIQKHSNPLTISYVYDEKGEKCRYRPEDENLSVEEIATKDLNSKWFHYSDAFYLGYLIALSGVSSHFTGFDSVTTSTVASLFFRGTAEKLRKSTGKTVGLFYNYQEDSFFSMSDDYYLAIDSIALTKIWSLKKTVISREKDTMWCKTQLTYTPPGVSAEKGKFALEAEVTLNKYGLNSIQVSFANQNVAIGKTGLYLQEAKLGVNHLNDAQPVSVTGNVRITFFREISVNVPDWLGRYSVSGALASFEGSLTVTSKNFLVSGTLGVPSVAVDGTSHSLVSCGGVFDFNWATQSVSFEGNAKCLIFESYATVVVSWGKCTQVCVAFDASLKCPDSWIWPFKGVTLASFHTSFIYSGGGNPEYNRLFMGGTLFGFGAGIRDTFAGEEGIEFYFSASEVERERLKAEQIKKRQAAAAPPVYRENECFVQPESIALCAPEDEYVTLILNWQSACDSPAPVLVLQDGTRVRQAQYADYGTLPLETEETAATWCGLRVRLDSFDFDNWTFEVEAAGAKIEEEVTEQWYLANEEKTIILNLITKNMEGSLDFAIGLGSDEMRWTDDTALCFYADEDNIGYDGIPIFQTTVGDLQNDTAHWNPEDWMSGNYYFYVMADEGTGRPVQSGFSDAVEVQCAPKLVVTDTSDDSTDRVLSWDSTTVNNMTLEYSWKEFKIENIGKGTATLEDWTFESTNTNAVEFLILDENDSEIKLDDFRIAPGESVTIRVRLDPTYLHAGTRVEFTLSATTNDESIPELTLSGNANVVPSVATLTGAETPISVPPSHAGSYALVLDS